MHKSTRSLIFAALALGIAPDKSVVPSAWAAANLVVPDGPKAGQKWDPADTPQLVEILDCLAPDHPANRISVRKSSQVGATTIGIAWMGAVITTIPAKGGVVFPTIATAEDFIREKFNPASEQSPSIKASLRDQRSRSGDGSTTRNKKFRGGSLVFTGANSAADLRSKTWKYAFCDEVDEWPLDLDKQGDPMEMVDARQISFHASGEYKKFEISTPSIKGASRIDAAFEAGDQRYWQVPCPHCGQYQRLIFKHLKFERTFPYKAHYVCAQNGCIIEHHQKRVMVRQGRWVAEQPGPGRHPSFHLDAISSLLTTWDKIAEKWWAAQGDQQKLQAFYNLWLGEAFQMKGEAPDAQRLFERRQAIRKAVLPPGVLFVTGAADVQHNRLEWAVYGWGIGLTSWLVDAGVIEGDPNEPGVWIKLDAVLDRRYTDVRGRSWPIDAFAVDSGYLSTKVYAYAARHAGSGRVFAIDGRTGWRLPALGTPTKKDVDYQGRKVGAAMLWPVGTWDMKSELYSGLRKAIQGPDADGCWALGTVHLPDWIDEAYCKQLTAEHLATETAKKSGLARLVWVKDKNQPNEALDIAVYSRALAHHLSDELAPEGWARLAASRGADQQEVQGDLARLWAPLAEAKADPAETAEPEPETTEVAEVPAGRSFIDAAAARNFMRR